MKHNKYILALAFASMLTLGSCGDDSWERSRKEF